MKTELRLKEPEVGTGLVRNIILVTVALVVFASLIGTVQNSISDAGLTGASGAIASNLLVLIFVIGVVVAIYTALVSRKL